MSTEAPAIAGDAASTPAADTSAAPGAEDEDISTEAFDRAPAPDDGEGGEGAEGGDDGAAGDGSTAAADDGMAEIELDDGTKIKVPKAAEAGYLKERDYRQKTMAHAEAVRAFEAERQSFATQQEESRAALPEEYAKVAIVSRDVAQAKADVAELEKIDWATWRAQVMHLPSDDPNLAQYSQYRRAYDAARETLADAQRNLTAATEDLTTKEKARLEEQAKVREESLATARRNTGQVLQSKGWDQQRFTDAVSFAVQNLGVSPQELETVTDPRVWDLIDRTRAQDAELAKLRKVTQQQRTAADNQKAQQSKPAETAKGSAQPNRVADDLGTKTWMDRRNKQLAAKGRR